MIREKFGANWVFTDGKENDEMVAKLLASGWAEIAYEDDEARILKIRSEKGDPPSDSGDDETPEEKAELDRMEQNDTNSNANANIPEDDEPSR